MEMRSSSQTSKQHLKQEKVPGKIWTCFDSFYKHTDWQEGLSLVSGEFYHCLVSVYELCPFSY